MFKLLCIALSDSKDNIIPKDVNWTDLFQLACNQGIIALVCDGLQKLSDVGIKIGELSETAQGKILKLSMIGQAVTVEETCKKQQEAAKRLSNLWAENGIRTLVLKGMAFGSYYPISNHRPCVDMDCYLCGKYEEGNKVIEDQGIEVKKEDYRHSTFFFGDLHVENHKICTTIRGRKQRKTFENYLRGLLEKKPTTHIDDSNLEIPCPMFNALYFSCSMHIGISSERALHCVMCVTGQ